MITLRNLTKEFVAGEETVLAMDNLTLDIESHCFFTLLGPSGCGKSTLLRCIAGLETPTSGDIGIGDKTVYSSANAINVSPAKRKIGMVFQSYAIWPHMTVLKNVAFPLEVQKQSRVRERAMEALAMVGLEGLAERYASRLSGGQQQRVAFARAVVAEPDLLLLDEPLSNLDAALREQMRSEMRNMQERLKITTLYVTHDQAEALSMSDRIAVMREGRFVEISTPEELYNQPKSAFTAQFLGGANLLKGTVKEDGTSADGTAIHTDLGILWSSEIAPAGPARLFLRPEKISIDAGATDQGHNNVFSLEIVSRRFVGDSSELELALPGIGTDNIIRSKIPAEFKAAVGTTTSVHIDPADVHILDN